MIINFKLLWMIGLMFGCNILSSSAKDSVPILLWDHYGKISSFEPYNPFHTTTHEEFGVILKKRWNNSSPPVLVLVKETFCSEDMIRNKESLVDLKNASIMYLSAVKSPVPYLKNLFSYQQIDESEVESIGDNQLAMVNVKNVEDAVKIYKVIRETSPNLVTILTGNSCNINLEPVRRVRRAEVDASNDTSLFFNSSDGQVLLYSSQFPFIKTSINGSFEQLTTLSSASSATKQKNSVILDLKFQLPSDPKITIKMNFTKSQGYYNLMNITYTDTSHPNEISLKWKKSLYVPQNFSYNCGEEFLAQWFFQNETGKDAPKYTIQLKFSDMQIQMDANKAFSEAYDCIGFTSIPIWTGIFVTFILGIILIWGLTMIIDIRTMDRFDDPKGKTITISAQE